MAFTSLLKLQRVTIARVKDIYSQSYTGARVAGGGSSISSVVLCGCYIS